MTDLLTFRSDVATKLSSLVPAFAEVTSHGGRFDISELKRWAAKSPGARVAIVGLDEIDIHGDQVIIGARVGVFVYAKDVSGQRRDAKGLALVNAVISNLPGERWDNADAQIPKRISAVNLYTPATDKAGIALWAITWLQSIDVGVFDVSTLDDFDTIVTRYNLGNDQAIADETTDKTDL